MASYYRSFVPNFSRVAALLFKIASSSVKDFVWSDAPVQSTDRLEENLFLISNGVKISREKLSELQNKDYELKLLFEQLIN